MLPSVNINYWAVLVSAIITMLIGMIWYSPVLFGNIWMKLMKINPKDINKTKNGMGKYYLTAFIATLLFAYVLALFIKFLAITTLLDGLQVGFLIWLGFVITIAINSVLWEGKPFEVYLINIAQQLVVFLAVSSILVLWA